MNKKYYLLLILAIYAGLSGCSTSKKTKVANQCGEQTLDTVWSISEKHFLVQNPETKRYKLVLDTTYENLKFARLYSRCFQVLDENNRIFYVSVLNGAKSKDPDFIGICGTVPHYTLSIKHSGSCFTVFEDETYHDYQNKIPPEKKRQICDKDVDSVLFINGRTEFKFDSNFEIGIKNVDPQTLILVKDGVYYFEDSINIGYDSINFNDYSPTLKTFKNGLCGLHGIIEPKYIRIGVFKTYLAEAETIDGRTIYIDIEGNEY
ncbi:MAG: hypothetical protein H6607_05285 [Flavobacteriales bacterium]|nr:hypothetical protein [Flavobacteriales bacterium]